ncbi:MAG TPA: RecQ family ATP-dependent DNA helicase [Pyrinomonadaceae bacterium]|nr:RecQ family ATP-dependent DNA helicase [Pyrinomonadaceae bacterium]
MDLTTERALELLRLGTQDREAQFRPGQLEAIQHLIENRRRLLVVQKTGWGKSAVYFIATKLLRDAGAGPALLISPLLSLMRNQIEAASRMGVRAETIHSDNRHEWDSVEQRLIDDKVDILLISPERLANQLFVSHVMPRISNRISLLVVDEAHCISDWGHDFRPHYCLIRRIVGNLPRNLRLLATTATANNRVMEDLEKILGPELKVMRGDLNRPSLFLQTIRLASPVERLAWLSENLNRLKGSGIIYTLTIRSAERVAEWLRQEGFAVECYTSQSGEQRVEFEQALLQNRLKALVATTALGMGFDKPDLSFVIHYQSPGSVIAYYQQVGRAGRALSSAYGILLSGEEETDITDYFIESAFPTPEEVKKLLTALKIHRHGLSIPELLREVNVSRARADRTIQLLALEAPAPVVKEGAKWILTTADLSDEFWERTRRLTELRYQEKREMQNYVALQDGHMEFLIRALDGNPENITRPNVPPLPSTLGPQSLQRALSFLRRIDVVIKPRMVWPAGGLHEMIVKGRISDDCQNSEGRCLCFWGDPGWGDLVRKGKYEERHFSDELIEGLFELVNRWKPAPFPKWVTYVPSCRDSKLVGSLAERFAKSLGIPLLTVIRSIRDYPPQKTMQNSTKQALNLDGVFGICRPCSPGAVFLIDDMIDSGWTMTVAGYLLRKHGSGPVYPLALALTAKS